ncbi:MAG: glutamate--cysteine ligase [Pseudomonadota bacterium]
MNPQLNSGLDALAGEDGADMLRDIGRGIEKESLRITTQGKIAQTPHPLALGSALTHDSITTDYSEALLEFITPVSTSIESSLAMLEDVHSFVYQSLKDELLWAASMPCIMTGDDGIPVAHYGDSNVAQMKKVYRYGLGHRYGRLMQTIAGIHYNFSMPQRFWEKEFDRTGGTGYLTDYISERYLGLIRNFRRHCWLLIYLFGASPAVCASFLRNNTSHQLEPFDGSSNTLHMPYGTALRMGDLGYNSAAQKGLSICYNSLDNYVDTLSQAIKQPHAAYAAIPSGQDGDWQQLNDSLLQIENEFYSPIRPKRVARSGEPPLKALRRGGIEYIEVRCVDVSPFDPAGLSADQVRFMDTFLLHCLLSDSPLCDEQDQARQSYNLEAVVNRGREPGLLLQGASGDIELRQWALELSAEMESISAVLDRAHASVDYLKALETQRARIEDPENTPSARVLREMRESEIPFFRLAMGYSERWSQYYRERTLSQALKESMTLAAAESLSRQADIEQSDEISFPEYLDRFYAQYDAL